MVMIVLVTLGAWLAIGFVVCSLVAAFEARFSKDFPEVLDSNEFFVVGIVGWPFVIIFALFVQIICRTADYLSSDHDSIVTRYRKFLKGIPQEKKPDSGIMA